MDVAEGRCMEDRDLENNNKSLVVPYFKRMEEAQLSLWSPKYA